MKSRIGKFYISQVLIREEIEEVAKVLSILKFVPLRIEYLYNDTVEMVGHSHMFKEFSTNQFFNSTLFITTSLFSILHFIRSILYLLFSCSF